MTTNSRLIDYMSIPVENIAVCKIIVENLRILFSDFDFKQYDNYYNFIYENLEINISNRGAVLISLVSASDYSENISILSELIDKINSVISVGDILTRISVRDLN